MDILSWQISLAFFFSVFLYHHLVLSRKTAELLNRAFNLHDYIGIEKQSYTWLPFDDNCSWSTWNEITLGYFILFICCLSVFMAFSWSTKHRRWVSNYIYMTEKRNLERLQSYLCRLISVLYCSPAVNFEGISVVVIDILIHFRFILECFIYSWHLSDGFTKLWTAKKPFHLWTNIHLLSLSAYFHKDILVLS